MLCTTGMDCCVPCCCLSFVPVWLSSGQISTIVPRAWIVAAFVVALIAAPAATLVTALIAALVAGIVAALVLLPLLLRFLLPLICPRLVKFSSDYHHCTTA